MTAQTRKPRDQGLTASPAPPMRYPRKPPAGPPLARPSLRQVRLQIGQRLAKSGPALCWLARPSPGLARLALHRGNSCRHRLGRRAARREAVMHQRHTGTAGDRSLAALRPREAQGQGAEGGRTSCCAAQSLCTDGYRIDAGWFADVPSPVSAPRCWSWRWAGTASGRPGHVPSRGIPDGGCAALVTAGRDAIDQFWRSRRGGGSLV